jgi:hypothetical protein
VRGFPHSRQGAVSCCVTLRLSLAGAHNKYAAVSC